MSDGAGDLLGQCFVEALRALGLDCGGEKSPHPAIVAPAMAVVGVFATGLVVPFIAADVRRSVAVPAVVLAGAFVLLCVLLAVLRRRRWGRGRPWRAALYAVCGTGGALAVWLCPVP